MNGVDVTNEEEAHDATRRNGRRKRLAHRCTRTVRCSNKKLAPGTLRRVVSFAEPYRKELAIFLLLTIISSVIGVVTPLLAGDVINEISAQRHGARSWFDSLQ